MTNVTMADIARAVGCSTMTVSLALRGSARVSEVRRKEIRTVATDLGYRPNPLVSALVSSRRKGKRDGTTIALLTKFDEPIAAWRRHHPFYSDLNSGMRERADELGFVIEEFPTHVTDAPSGARLSSILSTRGIRGLILFPGGGFERDYPDITWTDFAVVATSFNARTMPVHRTATDYAMGMSTCLEELTRRGYRRIGLAVTHALDPTSDYSLSGRYLAWREQQPTRNRIPLIQGGDELPVRAAFEAWFKKHRPECILATDHYPLEWLQEMGCNVPEDVGVAVIPLRGRKNLAGFDARTRDVGRMTVNVLARELFLNHFGLPALPEASYIAGTWRDGATVRKAIDRKTSIKAG